MEIIVRKANSTEQNIIVKFQIQMAFETENLILDNTVVSKGVRKVFEDSSKGQYWVAVIDNNVIASMLITQEWSDWRNKAILWFQSVYVIPDYRKMGIFKKMYNKLKSNVLKSDKYAGLRLYVDKTNNNAQSVYEKLGMNGDHYRFYEWMIN